MVETKSPYIEMIHGKLRQVLFIGLGLSTALFASFHKNANIVTDSITGLQWQDDTIGTTMTWEDAIAHCENLSLDGHDDWRLPNIKELVSLVDDSRLGPSIDTSVFEYTASNDYWSSTTNANFGDNAWIVYFRIGFLKSDDKNSSYYVRCVRGGE